MELIDVLTAEGAPTGVAKSKADVHRDGDWHVSAHVWIVTPDDRVLLQRRAEGKENHPGLWDVSVAGHLSSGERAVEAAVRECREEIGLTLEPEELEPIGSMRSEQSLNGGRYLDREIHKLFLLRRELSIDALVLDAAEVAEVLLVSLEELEERANRKDPTLVDHGDEYRLVLEVIRGCGRP